MNDDKLVQDAFFNRFKGYRLPKKLNLAKLPAHEKKAYYTRCQDLVENIVFFTEFQEWKRQIFHELAMNTKTELERQGYRMTLNAIDEFEKRLRLHAGLKTNTPLKRINEML